MKPREIAEWLNKDATDEEFAEVFALLEIGMCGRGIPKEYDTETIIRNTNFDTVCNKVKDVLKDIRGEEVEEKLLTMPRGLCLFHGDYIDDYDGSGRKYYVVARTENSAFNRFYKRACSNSYSFTYNFYEIDDEETVDEFVKKYGRENIKAGLYSRWW